MNLGVLVAKMPQVLAWIDRTLAAHASHAQPLTSWNFQRLIDYYSAGRIARTKVVIVPSVPVPARAYPPSNSVRLLDRFRFSAKMI